MKSQSYSKGDSHLRSDCHLIVFYLDYSLPDTSCVEEKLDTDATDQHGFSKPKDTYPKMEFEVNSAKPFVFIRSIRVARGVQSNPCTIKKCPVTN